MKFYLNYSKEERKVKLSEGGMNLLTGERMEKHTVIDVRPWDLEIIEEKI